MGMAAPECVVSGSELVESRAETGTEVAAGINGDGRGAGFGSCPAQVSEPACRHRAGCGGCDGDGRRWLAPESAECRTNAQMDAVAIDIGGDQVRGVLVSDPFWKLRRG